MSQSGNIRAGLVQSLAAIRRANIAGGGGIEVGPYLPPNPVAPSLYVMAGKTSYDKAMAGGLDELYFHVIALAGASLDELAQRRLDELREPTGSTSVKALIEADDTLGGTCDTLRVSDASAHRPFKFFGGGEAFGCEWIVCVKAPRD